MQPNLIKFQGASANQSEFGPHVREMAEAARAMREAAERMNAVAAAQQEAQNRQAAQERFRERDTRTGAAPETAGAGLGAVGRAVGTAGAVMTGMGAVMDRVSKAAEIMNDSFSTGAQKTRALVNEFVPFGEKLTRLGDALDGTADRMARAEFGAKIQNAEEGARYAGEARQRTAAAEEFAARSTLAATQRYRLGGLGTFDRSTVLGTHEYNDEQATQPAWDARTRAQREVAAARANSKYAENAMAEAERNLRARKAGSDAANRRHQGFIDAENRTGFRYKAERAESGSAAQVASVQLANAQKQYEEEITRSRERRLQLAQAESNLRKADVEYSRAQLEVEKNREARQSAISQGIGAQSKGERMSNFNALKLLESRGIENLPPELQEMAARVAPEYVAKQREKFGEQALRNEGGFSSEQMTKFFGKDFDKTLAERRENIDKLQADVRMNVQIDEDAFAKAVVEALGPVLGQLVKATTLSIEQQGRDIRNGVALANNARN